MAVAENVKVNLISWDDFRKNFSISVRWKKLFQKCSSLFSYFASRENSYYLFPPYRYYLSSVFENIINGKDGSIRMNGNKFLG